MSQVAVQTAISVTLEVQAETTTQHTFVCGHPIHSEAMRDGQRFFRDAAFRGPDSDRSLTENLFVKIEAAQQLFARVFRVTVTILGQRQAG